LKITYDSVSAFVRKRGSVNMIDDKGQTRILKSGQPDSFDLLDKATSFEFQRRHYNRAEFENLLNTAK
jgi:hypothetical protein